MRLARSRCHPLGFVVQPTHPWPRAFARREVGHDGVGAAQPRRSGRDVQAGLAEHVGQGGVALVVAHHDLNVAVRTRQLELQ